MAFAVTHPIPHDNISTEIHRRGGPFTLVPLPNHEDRPSSAVVWMETSSETARLMALPPEAFEKEMSERSCYVLGPLKLATTRSVWPIISQIAERLNGKRIALVAEAAHVIPPIGAQGLNMSLSTSKPARYRSIIERYRRARCPEKYHRERINDVRMRVSGISLLNQASLGTPPSLKKLRPFGIRGCTRLPRAQRIDETWSWLGVREPG